MHNRTIALAAFFMILSFCTAVEAAPPAPGKEKTKPTLSSSELKDVVVRFFQAKKDYKPGDLLTRESVAPLFKQLENRGFPAADAKKISENIPSDDAFIARQFATPAGQVFMRNIAKYPEAYDRVDRLSRMVRGQQTVEELIRGPGGEKMIEYMTTARGGKELGKMLENAPNGEDFNRPTGRIYTADQLLERLEAARAKTGKK